MAGPPGPAQRPPPAGTPPHRSARPRAPPGCLSASTSPHRLTAWTPPARAPAPPPARPATARPPASLTQTLLLLLYPAIPYRTDWTTTTTTPWPGTLRKQTWGGTDVIARLLAPRHGQSGPSGPSLIVIITHRHPSSSSPMATVKRRLSDVVHRLACRLTRHRICRPTSSLLTVVGFVARQLPSGHHALLTFIIGCRQACFFLLLLPTTSDIDALTPSSFV